MGVVGAVVAFGVVFRQPPQPSTAPPKNAPLAQLVTRSTRVTPAERRAIDKVLDRFIPAALTHRSMRTAWKLSGPELTGGSSLEQWLHGTSPIPYYPVAGATFHDWTTIDAGPGYVVFNLLVHPRRSSKLKAAWVFSGEMIHSHSHWLVNRLYTIALFNPATKSGRHEVGPADFAAASPSSAAPPVGHGLLGKQWLLAIVGVIALAVLFPAGFGLVSVLRARRRRRRYERPRDKALPPLPHSYDRTAATPPDRAAAGPQH